MTTMDDFDRRLGLFLDEGPTRSPDRPLDQAIAHARAHPRRRDPFAALRRDPMSGPPMAWTTRPALVLAALALLVALSAALWVGSQQRETPQVVPPIPSATAVPSTEPSASPSPSADPTPREVTVELTDANGQTKTLVVVDESGLLEDVFAGEQADPTREQDAPIEAVQVGADEGGGADGIVLHWVDLGCPDAYRLTIDETARAWVLDTPDACAADAIGVNHMVTLIFREPLPADEVSAEILPRPAR